MNYLRVAPDSPGNSLNSALIISGITLVTCVSVPAHTTLPS